MRCLLCLLACLLLACPLHAQQKAKPNTLTPKEIAEGWILLFDGETTFGWTINGEANVTEGTLVLGGDKPTLAALPPSAGGAVLRFDSDGQGSIVFESGINSGAHPLQERTTARYAIESGKLRFGVFWRSEGKASGRMNEQGRVEYLTSDSLTIRFKAPEKAVIRLHDIKLKPTGLKPLFNGKDLAGWKEHPDKKSKFGVTPEGWLHIKDGPGDLQTEALYDDFILQLECKTNGKQLNSGVFFRCRPGEYQQGYEAQIHNGFDADNPKGYVVEEYDPKTNELKDKQNVRSTAIDYGTGGIYRRVPARKQAAKDREWFTMTVIAHGRHIATWVNGIQMVDWTDNRPLKDNARNGCRLEKGAISLQGHDPTTDLYFRNIRIAELPKNVVPK